MLKEFLEEYMRVMRYDRKEFANRCGINQGDLSSILNKTRGTSIAFFKKISLVTGFSIDMLISLNKSEKPLEIETKFLKQKYLKDLIAKKYLPKNSSSKQIINFLGLTSEKNALSILKQHGLRVTNKTKKLNIFVEIACFNKKINDFDNNISFKSHYFEDALANVKKIINSNQTPQVAIEELKKYGIYVINSDVNIHSSLRGITVKRKSSFFIYISNNQHHQYEASYWMTLAHELMHIKKTSKMQMFNHNEKEIDEDAIKWLLGEDFIDIINSTSLEDVKEVAKTFNINDNIVQNYVALKLKKPFEMIRKKILWR